MPLLPRIGRVLDDGGRRELVESIVYEEAEPAMHRHCLDKMFNELDEHYIRVIVAVTC